MGHIEWVPGTPTRSDMNVEILDPNGVDPINIIDKAQAFKLKVTWKVIPSFAAWGGGSFRLRAFVESIGPGSEVQLPAPANVPFVSGQIDYGLDINVPANTLLGEGELDGGLQVSGCYKVAVVLQHLNPTGTAVSGYAELDGMLMVRAPA